MTQLAWLRNLRNELGAQVVGPGERRRSPMRAVRPEQVVPRADLSKVPNLKRHGSAVVKLTVELGHAEAELQPPSVTVKW